MANPVLPLEIVFNEVKARFALEAPNVRVVFGWREPGKQINQGAGRAMRIAFEPGTNPAAGEYYGARNAGANPRPRRTHLETCTVYCWGFDGLDPTTGLPSAATANDELAQYRAATLLHHAAVRAIDKALRKISNNNAAPFDKPEWVMPSGERGFGAELKFVLSLENAIKDELPDLSGGPYTDTQTLPAPIVPGIQAVLNVENDGPPEPVLPE